VKRSVIVAVGDELLAGVIVNSNAAMIGELMQAAGYPVVWSMVVGDEEGDIVDAVARAARDADVVIVSGGLGPTQDDKTRQAIARLLGSELIRDESIVEDIRARFRAWGREMPESNAQQADIPAGATVIINPWGTAPGIRAELDGALIFAIPGVPGEAKRMIEEQILPELGGGATIRARMLKCVGMSESGLADLLGDIAVAANPRMAFLPGGGEIRLRFVATAGDEAECVSLLDEAEKIVRERVGEILYGVDEETLEFVIGRMLKERGLTVGTAESCTAGALAARIANIPGSSDYLVGGIVTYASEAKTSQLGVPAELISEHGAVSEPVTRAMALGAKERLGAGVAVSVTCAAGPEPQDGAKPGTIFLGVAGPGDTVDVRGVTVPGDRAQVVNFATTFALSFLRAHLLPQDGA
jgi:competence/damage-inducible protein CinA-like protein